jgi:hypothetical protein
MQPELDSRRNLTTGKSLLHAKINGAAQLFMVSVAVFSKLSEVYVSYDSAADGPSSNWPIFHAAYLFGLFSFFLYGPEAHWPEVRAIILSEPQKA